MNVLMVVPELAPFFKYSRLGLGENLRSQIFHLPESVVPIMPQYEGVQLPVCRHLEPLPGLGLEVCETLFPASERRALMLRPVGGAFAPFVDATAPREQIVLFNRGVAAYVQRHPEWDVVHAHHWPCGLVPLLLRNLERPVPTLFTFYDLEEQPRLFADDLGDIELNPALRERVQRLTPFNLTSLGIRFARLLSTTSRRYAEEVRTEKLGHGLERLFVRREERMFGVMNGVRYGEWNPAKDVFLAHHYSDPEGKKLAKRDLQRELELPESDVPLVFYGGRLNKRYGCDLFLEALPELAEMPLQIVVYGTGDDEYLLRLEALRGKCPNVRVRLGYDEAFLHRLVAGADMHLLPSFEQPGGTNHLVSLRYGVVPVARRTGGYVDAIHDQSDRARHKVNGFLFGSYYANSFVQTVQEALDVYAAPDLWREYVQAAMDAEWTWKENARAYENLYRKLVPE